MTDHWFDDAAGPVVRPYAMTRGRTSSGSRKDEPFDLIALVVAEESGGRGPLDRKPADDKRKDADAGRHDEADAAAAEADADDTAADAAAADSDGPGPGLAPGSSPDVDDAGAHADLYADATLAPEHIDIVERCRRGPQSVAELAVALDLPVGVVRVLIGDLVDAEWVRITRPVPPAELPDENVLREVIDGLRAL